MLKRIITFIGAAVFAAALAGCQKEATIIDVYHADTEKLKVTEAVFSETAYEPYTAGGVLFRMYTVQTPAGSGEDTYYKYSLNLGAYKINENIESVVVNSVKVTGTKEIDFPEQNLELALPLEFSGDSIQQSKVKLIEELHSEKLNFTKNSELTVVINVSVVANGETITKDLPYVLETRFRTYKVQR